MAYSLGIDLGTTYTAAAVSDGAHAEIVPLGDRSPQAPSIVYQAPDGTFRYGEAAERKAAVEPERVAREFKRRLGDQTPIFVAGSPLSAHALSKALLGWTIDQVQAGQGEPPESVRVTCPANWGPYRRELMGQVTALNADFPIAVCTEPEAAAVHFAASRRIAAGQSVAVYDLGGGTFDAAVLRRRPDGAFEVLGAPDGLEQLGGVDFDEAVFERVSRGIEWDRLDPDDPDTLSGLARLRRDCTEAKESLSSETEATVPILLGGRLNRVRLTRAEFQEMITPLVTDTIDILDRVIRRSGVPAGDLSAIVLVGGSSRVPLVSELITRRFGRPAVLSPQPKLCVAMGAALLADPASAPAAGTGPVVPSALVSPSSPMPPSSPVGPSHPMTPSSPATSGTPVSPSSPVTVITAAGPASLPTPAAPVSPVPSVTTPISPVPSATAHVALPAEPSAAPGTTRSAAAPGPIASAPPGRSATEAPASDRTRRRPAVYPLVSAAMAVAAVLLMVFGPAAVPTGQTWNAAYDVPARGEPAGARLTVSLLGVPVTRPPVTLRDNAFDLAASRVFLAGPVHGRIDAAQGGRDVVLTAADRWGGGRWLSLPFAALVLTALFSFAYVESLLRPIRRRRTRASAGEVLGLVGCGLVAGVAAALFTWVVGDRLPDVATVLGIVVCVCAAVGLLGLAWPERQSPA